MGILVELGIEPPRPNAVQKVVHKVAGSSVGGAVLSKIAPPLDKLATKATRGRATTTELLTGLPILMLTTTGARSGKARTHPVLGIPFGDDIGLQSGNFGVKSVPDWVRNLQVNPTATVAYDGNTVTVVARAASTDEAAAVLSTGTDVFAGLANYGQRAGRNLDVFVLTKAESA